MTYIVWRKIVGVLEEITEAVVRGHVNAQSNYPPDLAGKAGVSEGVEEALRQQIEPGKIIQESLIPGMDIVGQRFKNGEYFLPDMLMSAQSMKAGMKFLEPLLKSGEIKLLGTVILGTVKGDMHDIGKNLVGIMLEGGGFEVIDLGADVSHEQFIAAAREHPDAVVGLSALLTTTRENMRLIVESLQANGLQNKVIIGGAAVDKAFTKDIRADGFTRNAANAVPMVKELLGIDA